MIGKGNAAHHYLNADLCYALWLTSGSIGRATRRLALEGFRNPVTLDKPSRMGVWFAAKRSDYYKNFQERRETGQILQQTATNEEFEEAKKIVEQLWLTELEKNVRAKEGVAETLELHD